MAGFVRQRNWVRESLPLVGDYSVVRLSYGCRSPSVSKVRGGSDKEAHDHLGEATNHAAVSFTLDSSVLNRDVNRLQRRSFVLNYHYAEGDAPLVLSFIDGSKHDDTVTLSVLHFLSMLVYVGSHVLPDDQKDFAAIRSQFLKVAMSIPVGTKESKVTLDQLGIY